MELAQVAFSILPWPYRLSILHRISGILLFLCLPLVISPRRRGQRKRTCGPSRPSPRHAGNPIVKLDAPGPDLGFACTTSVPASTLPAAWTCTRLGIDKLSAKERWCGVRCQPGAAPVFAQTVPECCKWPPLKLPRTAPRSSAPGSRAWISSSAQHRRHHGPCALVLLVGILLMPASQPRTLDRAVRLPSGFFRSARSWRPSPSCVGLACAQLACATSGWTTW